MEAARWSQSQGRPEFKSQTQIKSLNPNFKKKKQKNLITEKKKLIRLCTWYRRVDMKWDIKYFCMEPTELYFDSGNTQTFEFKKMMLEHCFSNTAS